MSDASDSAGPTVVDNRDANRFELDLGDDGTAVAEYMRVGDTVVFTHTEVPEELEGRGIGGRLARGALDLVRENGERVRTICPFMSRFISEHAEYRDLTVRVGREA